MRDIFIYALLVSLCAGNFSNNCPTQSSLPKMPMMTSLCLSLVLYWQLVSASINMPLFLFYQQETFCCSDSLPCPINILPTRSGPTAAARTIRILVSGRRVCLWILAGDHKHFTVAYIKIQPLKMTTTQADRDSV